MVQTLRGKIGYGVAWLTMGDVVVKVLSLAYLFVVITQLELYEYGLVKLALSIPAILSLVSLEGLQQVMIADISNLKKDSKIEEMRYLLNSFVSVKYLFGSVAALVLFSATYFLDIFFSESILNLVRILSLLFLIGPVRSLIQIFLNVDHDFKSLAMFQVCEELMKLLFVICFVVIFDFNVTGVIISSVLTALATSILFLPVILKFRNAYLERKFFSRGILAPLYVLYDHSKWSVFIHGVHSLSINFRPWIVQFLLGLEAVGLYGLAVSLLRPMQTLLPVSKVILPIMSEFTQHKKMMVKLINSGIKYKLYGQISIVFLALASLPLLINNYFPKYTEAYWLFAAMTLAFLPQAFSQIFAVVFHALKLQKDLFFSTTINLGVSVVVLFLCVSVFGLLGAAVELFVTQSFFLVSRYYSLKKNLPDYQFAYRDLFTFTETDKLIFKGIRRRVPVIN